MTESTSEAAEIAARAAELEELAAALRCPMDAAWEDQPESMRERYRARALDLIASGWRKAQA